jgi:hypothetical protein
LPRHLPKIWHPVTIPPPWLWELWQCTRELFVTRALAAQSCLWWSLWDYDLSMSLKCIALLVWKHSPYRLICRTGYQEYVRNPHMHATLFKSLTVFWFPSIQKSSG